MNSHNNICSSSKQGTTQIKQLGDNPNQAQEKYKRQMLWNWDLKSKGT